MVAIFVSSTSKDLLEHRKVVLDALTKAGHNVIAMEHFNSQPADAETVSTDEVRRAELFVGIYAHRYGYRPDNHLSVTEQEFIAAKLFKIPPFIFIVEESYRHPLIDQFAETDPESIQMLKAFKTRLEKNYVRKLFTSPEDLALSVIMSVNGWLQKQPQQDNSKPSEGIRQNTATTGGIAIYQEKGDITGNTFNTGKSSDK